MKNGVYKNSNKLESHSLWKDIFWKNKVVAAPNTFTRNLEEEYCLTGGLNEVLPQL